MTFEILFVLFYFFTHKQVYASRHFTGSSVSTRSFIGLFGFVSTILEIIALVRVAINGSVLSAIGLFVVSFVCTLVLNSIVSKIMMKRTLNEYPYPPEVAKVLLARYGNYNYKCDVASTILAIIGIVYNISVIIWYICIMIV